MSLLPSAKRLSELQLSATFGRLALVDDVGPTVWTVTRLELTGQSMFMKDIKEKGSEIMYKIIIHRGVYYSLTQRHMSDSILFTI